MVMMDSRRGRCSTLRRAHRGSRYVGARQETGGQSVVSRPPI